MNPFTVTYVTTSHDKSKEILSPVHGAARGKGRTDKAPASQASSHRRAGRSPSALLRAAGC